MVLLALGVGGVLVSYVVVLGAGLTGGPEVPRLHWRHARADLNLVRNAGSRRLFSPIGHTAASPTAAPAGSAAPTLSPRAGHVSGLGVLKSRGLVLRRGGTPLPTGEAALA
jgi:hypothetical protein